MSEWSVCLVSSVHACKSRVQKSALRDEPKGNQVYVIEGVGERVGGHVIFGVILGSDAPLEPACNVVLDFAKVAGSFWLG